MMLNMNDMKSLSNQNIESEKRHQEKRFVEKTQEQSVLRNFDAAEIIKNVMSENGYTEINEKSVRSMISEFNSKIKTGLNCTIQNEKIETVTAVITEDNWILNFYTEVEGIVGGNLRGFGFAKNLDHEHLSEWGYLYTPLGISK